MFMLRQFRRHFLFLILCGLVATGSIAATPSTAILPGKRVLVLGDSITQDGRYVSFLEYYLRAAGQKCDLISIGLGSETVSGLSEKDHPYPRPCVLERLDRALKAVKPSLVLACYGMNDGIYHPPAPERLAAFNTGLRQLIEKVRATGAQLVLITPPVFDPLPLATKTVPATAEKFGYGSPYSGYDDVLAAFAAAEVALNEPGVTVIDLHTALARELTARRRQEPKFTFARDGVHPDDTGHLLIARTIATGLGLILSPTETDVELARLRADPLFSLVREQRELRSETWLPFVGYTRGQTFKSASVDSVERTILRLAQQIHALAPKPVPQD
jgi:lysophospholipase L1-like esterase